MDTNRMPAYPSVSIGPIICFWLEERDQMINIMLADDEVLAPDYLKNMVEWEKYGYHIVGAPTPGKKRWSCMIRQLRRL